MIATIHDNFPVDLWDDLIPQLNLTINLLRPFNDNPKISAYEGIHGHTFDFSAHPIAPVGTKVVLHESPDKRTTWGHMG